MRTCSENGYHYILFDHLEDMLAGVKLASEENAARATYNALHQESFVGREFTSWEQVYRDAQAAWPEGLATVDQFTSELGSAKLPKPVSRRRRPRFAEDNGDELEYDRLRSGQPFWRTSRRERTAGPQTVTILVNVATSACVDHNDILWRGAAALAMTKLLEEAGFRVELYVMEKAAGTFSDGTGNCTAVCMKRAGDPLDMSSLVSTVSGWFFRSMFFRAKCIEHQGESGLGSPTSPDANDIRLITGRGDAVVLTHVTSFREAADQARAALDKLLG